MKIVVLGLSITSSWGNGHAVTYRTLLRGLRGRGHDVVFLERDVPWYAVHRDAPGTGELYGSLDELRARYAAPVRDADLVVVGSYVPEGPEVASWALETARGTTAFYDVDTPVTLAKLAAGDAEYLTPELVPAFDVYFSFTGGPTLQRLEYEWRARHAVALYCAADPDLYFPEPRERRWALGYLGTYSDDRQPTVEELLVEPARLKPAERFVVAGPQYPQELRWPANVERLEHVPPAEHRGFYAQQALTLNVTRADMVAAGWSPSVRLFEAAACGVPVVSDSWEGLDELFEPGEEIVIAQNAADVLEALELAERERRAIGESARARVLAEHTPEQRALTVERSAAMVGAPT